MFYDRFTRTVEFVKKPVVIGGSIGFIVPITKYKLDKNCQYMMEIKITNLTLKEKEEDMKWYLN